MGFRVQGLRFRGVLHPLAPPCLAGSTRRSGETGQRPELPGERTWTQCLRDVLGECCCFSKFAVLVYLGFSRVHHFPFEAELEERPPPTSPVTSDVTWRGWQYRRFLWVASYYGAAGFKPKSLNPKPLNSEQEPAAGEGSAAAGEPSSSSAAPAKGRKGKGKGTPGRKQSQAAWKSSALFAYLLYSWFRHIGLSFKCSAGAVGLRAGEDR